MRYEIKGENLPVVVCYLDAGEEMVCEGGSMSWMDDGIRMQTEGGGLGKIFGRVLTGEKMFRNRYVADRAGEIAFASSFPGSIRAVQVTPDKPIIAQKGAFLASYGNLDVSVHFQRKLGGGLFGGEGFIMQRLSGQGMAFLECDGSLVRYELAPGQSMVVDTGNVLGFTGGVDLRVEKIQGAKNVMFGGEGLFNTILTGPGTIYLQTMPLANIVDVIAAHMPTQN